MPLDPEDLKHGTELFIKHLEGLQAEDPELTTFHAAFEDYCMNKYSLGSSAVRHRTAGKHDLGIDFYSTRDHRYHIAQCKIPEVEWLQSNTSKVKAFGPSVLADPRSALEYLVGESKATANDSVRHLYTLVEGDRSRDDFELAFFLIVYGRLNDRAAESFQELKQDYASRSIKVVLQQIDDLVDEFILGASRENAEIRLDLRISDGKALKQRDYCYFLANTADVFKAFQDYGWRLFDLNLRYEVRNSPVNGDIITSLSHPKSRRKFHHFNNGLIIVTNSYTLRDQDSVIRLTGAQIVNGLQTVKSIYNAVSEKEVSLVQLEAECVVQVKVITVNDPEFVSDIVQATNNQNPMAARNLRANNREQKQLRTEFAGITPRWFYQLKQGEWESLNQESGRFFKQVIGFPPSEFRPDPGRKRGRVIDNQDAAKAWLAFIGFADLAGDRVTHFFTKESEFEGTEIYSIAFTKRPSDEHWRRLGQSVEFDSGRIESLESRQGSATQYLLAYAIWQFVKSFIPAAQQYRQQALEEGVRASKIEKASGSIVSTPGQQEAYLATNTTYQIWRLMANMKELLVEAVSFILLRRYGKLDAALCKRLLEGSDLKQFVSAADVHEIAEKAASGVELRSDEVFSRILGFLRHVCGQFWEEKQKQLLSTSRLRTVLVRRDMATDFKRKIEEIDGRRGLDKPWKAEGQTFLESLPEL